MVGGLHQAIEAKEGVRVMPESITLASITFQNYFRMYDKLAGMTGTAETSAEEFDKVYGLEVVVVPTNKKIIRKDLPDKIYKTEEAKFRAVVKEIKERHQKGQPVLVGTTSIDKNEYLGALLEREGIPHKVLNAKHHEQEGEIIAQAGKKGAVTIATNMAGRGVDISLGGVQASPEESEEVKKLGGLCVIGTERHEARRIDNQLRGRAGRQGDPGETQFFISLEDDVIRIFGGDKIKALMERFNIDEDTPIENALISRSIESAQSKIEGFNFDSRKHVLEYDDVLNKQRNTIYSKRDDILGRENLRDMIVPLLSKYGYSEDDYNRKEKEVGEENMRQIEKIAGIRAIDSIWIEHLENMESLKDSVRLRAYGQRDPLVEYKKEGHRLFKELLENCERNMVESIMKATINIQPLSKPEEYSTPKNKTGISRNDPCPCGSGKKYKKCCGK
jgi:preprotein translocase subunit SecA